MNFKYVEDMYLDMNNGNFSWFYLMLTTLLIARLECKLMRKVGNSTCDESASFLDQLSSHVSDF